VTARRIDIHAHFFPRIGREDAAAVDPRAPWLADHGDGTGEIMVGERSFRPVDGRLWDARMRLNWMDEAGVDVQFVCATPVMFGYAWDAARTAAWAARMNDAALAFCRHDPVRLKALAQVPLQDVDRACAEVSRAKSAGHLGVQIGNHVGEKGMDVQRYKGLGEMNAEQLWSTTMNPETRTLRQVTIESAAESDHIFSMLMGDDVPPRRAFIEDNALNTSYLDV